MFKVHRPAPRIPLTPSVYHRSMSGMQYCYHCLASPRSALNGLCPVHRHAAQLARKHWNHRKKSNKNVKKIEQKRGQSFVDVIVKMNILSSKCASAAASGFITPEERCITGARENIPQKSSMVSRMESHAQHREFPVSLSFQNAPTSTLSLNTFPVGTRDIREHVDTEMSRRLIELGTRSHC